MYAFRTKGRTMSISEVIRDRRRGLGLTQEQVALRLGVSAPAVNKWERGACYPDITLIPALARLLETDANTLLSFEPELSEEASLAIQREVDRLVLEEGYEVGFAYAQEQMRMYPASDELAIVLTQYLDGSLLLCQVSDQGRFRAFIDETYNRLSRSSNAAVRDQARGMLIATAMQDGRLDVARALVDELPDNPVDKEERKAILYMREGKDEEAGRAWEARLMRIASDMMGAINGLIGLALKDGRRQDAHECAQRAKAAFEALGQPAWLSLMPSLVVMTAGKAANETAETLDAILTSMRDERAGALEGALYHYVDLNDLTELTNRVSTLLLSEVESDDDYAFLRDSPTYPTFIRKWK